MRLRRMCFPIDVGTVLKAYRFRCLSEIRTNGKKATPPCPCGYLGHWNGQCSCTPDRQMGRQGSPNGRLEGGEIETRCVLSVAARKLLRDAASRLSLSARGDHRVLKVARTIADLAGRSELATGDVAEALLYRPQRIVPSGPR